MRKCKRQSQKSKASEEDCGKAQRRWLITETEMMAELGIGRSYVSLNLTSPTLSRELSNTDDRADDDKTAVTIGDLRLRVLVKHFESTLVVIKLHQ